MTSKIDHVVYNVAHQLQLENIPPPSGSFDKIPELILLVKHLPALYDPYHDDFKNRDLYWVAIGDVLKYTALECKNRFKYLRERYAKEKRLYEENEKSFPSGMWPHYEELSYLEPFVRFRLPRLICMETSSPVGPISLEDNQSGFMSTHISLLRRLILAVRNNPLLYDKSIAGHKCKDTKAKTWSKIAKDLNVDSTEIQLRWKSLRDRAGKEKNEREQAERDGSPYASRWPFEPDLAFLYKYIKPRMRQKRIFMYGSEDEPISKIRNLSDVKCEPLEDLEYDETLNLDSALDDSLNLGQSRLNILETSNELIDISRNTKGTRRSKRNKTRNRKTVKPQFVDADFSSNQDPFDTTTSEAGHMLTTDEDEIFGQSIAAELRRVKNGRRKMQLKAAIFKLLCDASSDSDLPISTDDIWTEFKKD